jgi:hypothetical protein
MKNLARISTSLILAVVLLFSFSACSSKIEKNELWKDATYLEDTEFGYGDTTITVEVKAGEDSITFTVNTNKDTVGAALIEHNLIEGTKGDYGLYIKKVNGITADYDVDKAYWSFYVNDKYANSGVDKTNIEKDAKYKLEYTK